VTLVAAAASVIFNLVSLPYEGAYENFLIAVAIVFCGLIGWYAWTWAVVL
jgi:TRAP-type C4-dicarboxylate transport system permease small subunit